MNPVESGEEGSAQKSEVAEAEVAEVAEVEGSEAAPLINETITNEFQEFQQKFKDLRIELKGYEKQARRVIKKREGLLEEYEQWQLQNSLSETILRKLELENVDTNSEESESDPESDPESEHEKSARPEAVHLKVEDLDEEDHSAFFALLDVNTDANTDANTDVNTMVSRDEAFVPYSIPPIVFTTGITSTAIPAIPVVTTTPASPTAADSASSTVFTF